MVVLLSLPSMSGSNNDEIREASDLEHSPWCCAPLFGRLVELGCFQRCQGSLLLYFDIPFFLEIGTWEESRYLIMILFEHLSYHLHPWTEPFPLCFFCR